MTSPDMATAEVLSTKTRPIRDLIRLVGQYPRALALTAVLGLAAAGATLAQPFLIQDVITAVSSQAEYLPVVALLAGLLVATGVINGLQQYRLHRLAEDVVRTLRATVVARLLRITVGELDATPTGDLVARATADTTALRTALAQGLSSALGGSFLFVGALVGMVVVDPVLSAVALGVVVIATGSVFVLAGRVRRASARAQERIGEFSSAFQRALSGLRTIRASGATDQQNRDMASRIDAAWEAGVRMARATAGIAPVSFVTIQMCLLVILGVGGWRVAAGTTDIGSLVAFALLMFLMVTPLNQAFQALSALGQAAGAYERIGHALTLPVESGADVIRALDAETATRAAPAVVFDDVWFSYGDHADTRTVAGLRGLSFAVPAGSRVALVGPSGGGKTTVLSLVERFYDPDHGHILWNGTDTRSMGRQDLRTRVGYVEQGSPALSGTLRDNLTLQAADATDDQCLAMLDRLGLTELLDSAGPAITPLLDMPIGEHGITLSGGQRQRLALARVLLARPSLLLLDETTSDLDSRSERLVAEAITAAAAEATVLVVAHRLSTVVASDRIVVLDRGQAVASGTHDELLGTSTLYRELAEFQLLT